MIINAPRRHGAALFFVMALTCFLAAAALIAARVSLRAADLYGAALRGALTVRIIGPDTDQGVKDAAEALRRTPGVYAARPVSAEQAVALLRKWTGSGVAPGDLPALRLIELSVSRANATPAFARELERALAKKQVQAEVFGPGQGAQNAANAALKVRDGAVELAAILAIAALATAGLVGRARAAADRALIAPLADLGATRLQAAAPFAARAATEGFMAGLLGAAGALAGAGFFLAQNLPNLVLDDWSKLFAADDAAPVAAAPILAALLAGAGARAAASRAYGRAARHS